MAIFESAFRSGHQAIRRASTLYRRFAHTVTIGVRAVVIDDEGRVFLVKHSYVTGWYLPGGGVEIGEALGTALARELLEEGSIKLTAPTSILWNVSEPACFATRSCRALRRAVIPAKPSGAKQ